MTFETIRGADAADLIQFIGEEDKDDILLALNETAPMFAEGKSGDDTLTFINTTGVVGQVTATGAEGDDLFIFTQDGNNVTAARLLNSDIGAGAGDDAVDISGGALASEIRTGAGVDTITLGGNYTNVFIKGGADGDVFTGGDAADNGGLGTTLELDTTKIRGQGDNDRAMDFRNFLISSDDSTINGNGGNDLLQFGNFDTVDGLLIGGGTGDDDIQLQNSGDIDGIVINGGSGADSVQGSDGDDSITGGTGNDTLRGNLGDDTIEANDGDDVVRAGGGADTVLGGAGDDNLQGEDGADSINGQDGDDALDGGAGADFISGGAGDDTITETAGDNVIEGGAGADTINAGGNADDDTITGGAGGDSITVDGSDDVLTYTAISDSNATSSTTEVDGVDTITNGFDDITGFAVVEAGGAYTSGTQIDISAIANILAGTAADSIRINAATDFLTIGGVPTATDFTPAATYGAAAGDNGFDLMVADFNDTDDTLVWSSNVDEDGQLEAFLFDTDIDGTGLATYLIINDTATQITSGDLMLQFAAGTTEDQIAAAIAEGSDLTIV